VIRIKKHEGQKNKKGAGASPPRLFLRARRISTPFLRTSASITQDRRRFVPRSSEIHPGGAMTASSPSASNHLDTRTHHRTANINGIEIFYREAGPADAPVVLLMHGWPSSSRMFRNLIPRLADKYHVIAPDYPGFGHSAVPDRSRYHFTFDEMGQVMEALLQKLNIQKFALYIHDFGGPVGYRLMLKTPPRLTALIVQNGPAYPDAGEWWKVLAEYWKDGTEESREKARVYIEPAAVKSQYLVGVSDPSLVDPDNWLIDSALIARPGLDEIHLDMLNDIRNNVTIFAAARDYLRQNQPPALIVTGANDEIFPGDNMKRYLGDLPKAEWHPLNSGHFALEDKYDEIASVMHDFLDRTIGRANAPGSLATAAGASTNDAGAGA
jgi:pimeloyl-ACP methyl ester carboxylesterase